MSKRRLIKIGFFIVLLAVIFAAAGCLAWPSKPPAPAPFNPVHHPFMAMTDTLSEIDSLMGVVYALSIAVFGLGVVLMFYLRTSVGPALMAGGLATLILSIFIKSLLWFVPWIAGGVLLFGLIAFMVDVRKRGLSAAWHDVRELVH